MRVLVFGGTGMLGHKLVQVFSKQFETLTTTRNRVADFPFDKIFKDVEVIENVDVRNEVDLRRVLEKSSPDAVVNAVGVVKQVSTAHNVEETLLINSIFPHRLATACELANARLIHVSTDCVFSGRQGSYSETDETDATDLYGRSKQLGEIVSKNCLTIRTSMIGRELRTSHSLLEWFLSQRGGSIKGFSKAIFSGFPTIVLSEIIAEILEKHRELEGLIHIASEPINKFALLTLIRDAFELKIDIEPSNEISIDRSLDATRFRVRTGFVPPSWRNLVNRLSEDSRAYSSAAMN